MFKIYDGILVKYHPKYKEFIKRFNSAIKREKFNRTEPISNTPLSTINSSKFILETEYNTIFINTPNFLFEELLRRLFKLAKQEADMKVEPIVLIQKIYNDDEYRKLNQGWANYSWTQSFDLFYIHIIEESFFYFDDFNDQYYFNIFRNIKEKRFEGGVLHALARHFDVFTKYDNNPNGNFNFQYNDFLWNLINCSINGKIVKTTDKRHGNLGIDKELLCDNKTLRIGLFWDNDKRLFFLNTIFKA